MPTDLVWICLICLAAVAVLVGVVMMRLRARGDAVRSALGELDQALLARIAVTPTLVDPVREHEEQPRGALEALSAASSGVQRAVEGGTVSDRSVSAHQFERALAKIDQFVAREPGLLPAVAPAQQKLTETGHQIERAAAAYNQAASAYEQATAAPPGRLLKGLLPSVPVERFEVTVIAVTAAPS